MGEKFKALTDDHIAFIGQQKIFFVGTATADSLINVSPKGMDSFRVRSHSQVMWLNLTGSGNETAAHVLEDGRMTIMFCSFDKQPVIMRLYGTARMVSPGEPQWADLFAQFPDYTGARQILCKMSAWYRHPAVLQFRTTSLRETGRRWTSGR